MLVTKVFTTSWFLNNFKTASPLPKLLHRWSVPKKAIKKGMTRTRVSRHLLDTALMMIDINGPDIQAVHEVKALILESVNAWKNYKRAGCRQGAVKEPKLRPETPTRQV